MAEYHKKFIALDLETTHLDMREGRIMEVGAVEAQIRFDEKVKKFQIEFGKEFASLVNSEISPAPAALALTGITAADLAQAPKWPKVKPDLKKFLGDAVLVGHNLGFDLDYLKNQGLNLKNPYWDTLELSQTFLPLSSAHSLEYLATSFGVLGRGLSHRAIADSMSSASVLVEILNQYLVLPAKLQKEIADLLSRSNLKFKELFLNLPQFPAISRTAKPRRSHAPASRQEQANKLELDLPVKGFTDRTLLLTPLGFQEQQRWLDALAIQQQPLIVAVAHRWYLDSLPNDQKIINPSWALCEQRWQWLKNEEDLPDPGFRTLIKIGIFQQLRNSWNLAELKWNPDERDFLNLLRVDAQVCPAHQCAYFQTLKLSGRRTYFFDLETLFALARHWAVDFSTWPVLLFDLGKIEDEFAESLEEVWNLRAIRSRLQTVYPLWSGGGVSRLSLLPKAIGAIADELDLFFGILHLVYLKKENEFAETILLDKVEAESERMQKLRAPVEKLLTKFESAAAQIDEDAASAPDEDTRLEFAALGKLMKKWIVFFKELFLQPRPDKFYWLKFNSQWVDAGTAPGDLQTAWQELVKKFKTLTVADTVLPELSIRYFKNRLGLAGYDLKKIASHKVLEIEVAVGRKAASPEEIVRLAHSLKGKAILLLPNERQLEETFHLLWDQKRADQEVLAYKFSGAVPLLRQKFAQSRADALLLLTVNIYQRAFVAVPPCQNLVIWRLPFEAPGTRLRQLAGDQQNRFVEEILPRGVHILHGIISRFLAGASERPKIYILDPRVLDNYDQSFRKYFEEWPNFHLVEGF